MAKDGYSDSMMSGGGGVSPRKAMAGVGIHDANVGGSNFGVQSFESGAQRHGGHHPDHVAGTGAGAHLADHDRAIGHAIHHTRHHHPAQAAPHHGPHHPDGYMHHQHEDHPEHRHETPRHKHEVKPHPKMAGGQHMLHHHMHGRGKRGG